MSVFNLSLVASVGLMRGKILLMLSDCSSDSSGTLKPGGRNFDTSSWITLGLKPLFLENKSVSVLIQLNS